MRLYTTCIRTEEIRDQTVIFQISYGLKIQKQKFDYFARQKPLLEIENS